MFIFFKGFIFINRKQIFRKIHTKIYRKCHHLGNKKLHHSKLCGMMKLDVFLVAKKRAKNQRLMEWYATRPGIESLTIFLTLTL